MMEQDLETKNESQLIELLDCIKEILKDFSDNIEIDSNKSVEECFKEMEKFARENQKNGCYAYTPKSSIEFIKKYLGLDNKEKNTRVNLFDFM